MTGVGKDTGQEKGAIRPSVIHSIFVRGANKSGKNKNLPRQIAIDTAFLPRASIQVTWQETPQDYAQHVAQADLTSLLSQFLKRTSNPLIMDRKERLVSLALSRSFR